VDTFIMETLKQCYKNLYDADANSLSDCPTIDCRLPTADCSNHPTSHYTKPLYIA